MEARRRSRLLLAGLGLVGFANGFFLVLSLYGLLAAFLHVFHGAAPPAWTAIVAGVLVGAGLLAIASLRERALSRGEFVPWSVGPAVAGAEREWEDAVAAIASRAGVEPSPRLRFVEGAPPNAFATDHAGDPAAIMVTDGLQALPPEQIRAVLAHEVAHVEAADVRAVAFADMIQRTIDDLSEAKGLLLWGPKQILVSLGPFLTLLLAGAILMQLMRPAEGRHPGAGAILLGLAVVIASLYWFWTLFKVALRSWRGLLQLFLFCTFFSWLSLVEAALAWPTSYALARLLSRQRVYAADARASELIDDPEALARALEAIRWVERLDPERSYDRLRFSLFARPRPQSGYRAWVERVVGTHPSAALRIERIRERATQERSRRTGLGRSPAESLEQSS